MFRKIVFSKSLLIFIASFFWVQVYAQKKEAINNQLNLEQIRGNKDCRLSRGKCKDVIKLLCIAYENDSIAVEIFKQEYEIINMRRIEKEWLLGKKNIVIFRYFMAEQNECYICRLKKFNQLPFDL